MPFSLALYKALEQVDPGLRSVLLTILEEIERQREESVNRTDFQDLKSVVKDLAEAQKELVKAQGRTEARVEELAEAQKRTQEELRQLAKSHKDLHRQVGGISNTIGYTRENQTYPVLPAILKKDFDIQVDELDRRFMVYDSGKDDEINIYGEGTGNDEPILIIGECKAQLGRRDIDSFGRLLERIKKHTGQPLFSLLVAHSVHPKMEEYAKSKGHAVYWSSRLDR